MRVNDTADRINLTHDGVFLLGRDFNLIRLGSMSSFHIHDDHQAALETKGLVVGRDVTLVGHGGKTDVKVAKDDEAARKGGPLELDREKTKDSWVNEVC